MKFKFSVNEKREEVDVSPKKCLLDILREDLNLTGTKEGCGKGECGACTVLMNGRRVNSCLVPALQIEGARMVTIEGLEQWQSFPAIEQAYIENGAVQCGFCISGFVMSTASLLTEVQFPVTESTIKSALGGNICRCTGYNKIIQAIQQVANQSNMVQQIIEDWTHAFEK